MMNPSIEFDFEQKTLSLMIPEGWKVSVMGADSGIGLHTDRTISVEPEARDRAILVNVTSEREAPPPSVVPAPVGDA